MTIKFKSRRGARRMPKIYTGLVTILTIALSAGVSLGQEAEGEESEGVEAKDRAPEGSLSVVLFVEGSEDGGQRIKVAGARVTVGDVSGATNDNGSVVLVGVPLGRHDVTIDVEGGAGGPLVIQGVGFAAEQRSQLLLTLDSTGALVGKDVEEPEGVEAPEEKPEEVVVEVQAPGKIVGRALNAETGEPIPGVQVYVRGQDEPLKTDPLGQFSIEVAPGLHDLSVLHSRYASLTREGVSVESAGTTELELKLNPSSAELEDMVVTEPYVEGGVSSGVAEERDSSAVQDVIGAEQMSKSGASDASSALGRVTGLTVVGGKFIYVRGMGERYSSTLLNGAQVPSPEPERRVVPLDLFPTTVLESVVVQKTYSPDMPAEFGGGVVQLRTRSYPEEFLFKVGGSLSGNTETTFRSAPTYEGGKTDWLGFDDGSRNRSKELAELSKPGEPLVVGNRFVPGLTAEEVNGLAKTLPNKWNTRDRVLGPSGRVNVAIGDTVDLLGLPVGYVVATQYSNEWANRKETRRTVQVSGGDTIVATDYDLQRSVNTVGITGMAGLGIEPFEGQSLFSNSMLLRTTDNTTLVGEGQGLEGGEKFTRLQYVERQLFTQQFRGEHVFEPLGNFQVDWRFVKSFADRSEPDRRDYRYDYLEDFDANLLSVRGGAVERFYSELDDKITEGGLDLTFPLSWTEELVTKFRTGGMLLNRQREVDSYRYQYRIDNYSPVDERNELRQDDLETILGPDNIGVGLAGFAEATGEDEPYHARQDIAAAYGMVETPLGFDSLNLMMGMRYEQSIQTVESTNERARLDTGDWLPAGTLTWAFIEDHQLRSGFSRTVSRPDFRELALARFFDVESSTEIRGNPSLRRATIDNYDLRYEWYFSGDESLSVAGFYKKFTDPIETVVLSGTSRVRSWQNANSATNVGLEFEARKRLGFVVDALDSFFVSGNISIINSKVQLAEDGDGPESVNTSSERPLEGQSPYVLNLQFGYDDAVGDDGNLSATVLFNIAGRRINGVGANGAPDSYEEAVPTLDFVGRHEIDSHWGWGVKLNNLLNPVNKTTQGDVETRRFRAGMSGSLSASYSY